MRLLVFFDLPTHTKDDRKIYAGFRKLLVKNGFSMLQYSVYERITRNNDDCERYISLIEANKPPKGDVRCLAVTERQFERLRLIIGSDEGRPDYGDSDLLEL